MAELDFSSVCYLVGIIIYIATRTSSVNAADSQETIIKHLDTVNHHLGTLSRAIRSAHTDLKERQYEECQLMGPIIDPYCAIFAMDKGLKDHEDLEAIINNHLAPGKRSRDMQTTVGQTDRKTILDELIHKQKMLENLKSVIDGAQSSIHQERKRSCNVNLGFHCQTEQYSAIADVYNWLQNSMSPGKRRRRDVQSAGSKIRQALRQHS